MKKGILFDLDGTLWDSADAVAVSWEDALKECLDVPKKITGQMMRDVMGKSMFEIADILFAEYEFDTRRRLLEYCCNEENAYIRRHGGQLFAGVEDTLQALRQEGYALYIVSNCQEGYIEAFLSYHKLDRYFDGFECFGRTKQGKAGNIRLVMEQGQIGQALYLGDTQGDYLAATEAGVPFVHARTGYGVVEAEVPFITELRQLPELASSIFAGKTSV